MNLNCETISFDEFPDICRLCLTKFPSPQNRFLIYGTSIENHSLEAILIKLFQIEVRQDDILPRYLCANCIFTLGQFYNFYEQCQKSTQTLCNIMLTRSNKDDVEQQKILKFILPKPPSQNNQKIPIPRLHPVSKVLQPVENESLQCKKCNLVLPNQYQLQKHIKSHKSPQKKPKETKEKRAGDENRSLKCTKCNIVFSDSAEYQKHRKTHESNHQCPFCKKTFKRSWGLNNHLRSHKDDTLKRDSTGRLIQCDICRLVCSSYHTLRMHKYEQHSEGQKPHVCQQCGQDFLTNSRLQKHLYTHTNERPFRCSKCPGQFKNQLYLDHHFKNIHEEDKPSEEKVKCTKCDRYFESARKMRNHRTTHITNKYLCAICGIYLARKFHYVTHLRRHTGEKPYKCEYCGKGFVARFLLKYHTNLHTGEKSYSCRVCGKGFLTPRRLRTHKKVHAEELYTCDICDKVFFREIILFNHMKTHLEVAEQETEENSVEETEEIDAESNEQEDN